MQEVVIITGCSGRIGRAVTHRLDPQRYSIIGFDVVAPNIQTENFEFVHTDLTSDNSVYESMQYVGKKYGNRIASVIHLAAYYNFIGGAWERYEQLTIKGTQRLLHAVQAMQTEQFIFSSTMLVHAPCQPGEKITENSPLTTNWEYPKSKVLTEELLRKEHGSLPLVILRIAGCYDDQCHSIPISNQIQRLYEHQLEGRLFPGNLTHGAPFLHLEDMADAILECIQKRFQLPKESVFLIGEEDVMSYGELQREISKLLDGRSITTYRIPKWTAKIGAIMQNALPFFKKTFIKPWMIDIADNHYELDMSHTAQLLGWRPKRSLRRTLPLMVKALQRDPQYWYQENGLVMSCGKKSGCCGRH
jgi:nucleoside-diphosphate-sugar epimerase